MHKESPFLFLTSSVVELRHRHMDLLYPTCHSDGVVETISEMSIQRPTIIKPLNQSRCHLPPELLLHRESESLSHLYVGIFLLITRDKSIPILDYSITFLVPLYV